MEDNNIIELFWQRSEKAIHELALKYGKYCYAIAYNILRNKNDSEECINDTYLKIWNSIPPQKPEKLPVYIGKITRNSALDKYRSLNRQKRGNGKTEEIIEELESCLPYNDKTEKSIDNIVITDTLNVFLSSLSAENRIIFMRRYWYMSSVNDIAKDYGFSVSKVKMSLLRSRNELKELLEKEGIIV